MISPRAVLKLLASLLVAGCGPATGPPPASPRTGPHRQPVAQTRAPASHPTRPAACRDAAGPLLQLPPLDLTCKHPDRFTPGSCQGKARIALLNCGRAPVVLRRVVFSEAGSGQPGLILTLDDARIAPGGAWRREQHFQRVGRFAVTAELGSRLVVQGTLVVTNATLEKARASCRACKGDFTARGMLGIVSCHCPMPDAGKPCTDGDQCQGSCVSTPRGFRCSRYRSVFGCRSYLPRGWSRQKPPARGRLRRVPSICVD